MTTAARPRDRARRAVRATALALAALGLPGCLDVYAYDPATVGAPEADVAARAPRAKTSTQFVRGLYVDLLGRAPTRYDVAVRVGGAEVTRLPIDEEAQLTAVLDGLGDGQPLRNLITVGLLHSAELAVPTKASISDPRGYIRGQFRKLLGRDPTPYQLEAITDAWASDAAVGPRTLQRALIGSREYQSQ
jgi:hypothetical protein